MVLASFIALLHTIRKCIVLFIQDLPSMVLASFIISFNRVSKCVIVFTGDLPSIIHNII